MRSQDGGSFFPSQRPQEGLCDTPPKHLNGNVHVMHERGALVVVPDHKAPNRSRGLRVVRHHARVLPQQIRNNLPVTVVVQVGVHAQRPPRVPLKMLEPRHTYVVLVVHAHGPEPYFDLARHLSFAT